MKRHKTSYPGVFYREAERIAGKGLERVYYIVFKRVGKVHEEKVGRQYADDMTPARAARIRAERIEGKRQSRKEIREAAAEIRWTVDRLWQEYVAHKPDTKGWRTDRYRYQKFLRSGLGGKEPKAIAQIDVHRLRIGLSKTLQPQTVKHVLQLLARIVNFGVKKGLCHGLAFKIEFPRVNNIKTEDLNPEQLQALMEAIDQEPDIQAANFMRMALFTGMRRGELFKLQWQDIDFDKEFIHIRGPKGGKDMVIPMNQAAREILFTHPRTDSLQVFPGRGGRQRTRIPKRIDAIREEAGLPPDFRPLHGLRHVYASMLASSGQVDLYVLQRLLTHKSVSMTQRYAHLRDEALRRASDLAGDLLEQVINGNKSKIANLRGEE
ncbi:MAG: site-specific integrase [Desulfobaccales bacterium]